MAKKKLLIAAMAGNFVLAATPSFATVFTMTFAGVVAPNSFDNLGLFYGPPGSPVVGDPWSLAFTYDTSIGQNFMNSSLTGGSSGLTPPLNPPNASGIFTIAGISRSISGADATSMLVLNGAIFGFAEEYHAMDHEIFIGAGLEGKDITPVDLVTPYEESGLNVTNASFDYLTYNPATALFNGDRTTIYLTINSVRLAPPTMPFPEPLTISLFGAGFLVLRRLASAKS